MNNLEAVKWYYTYKVYNFIIYEDIDIRIWITNENMIVSQRCLDSLTHAFLLLQGDFLWLKGDFSGSATQRRLFMIWTFLTIGNYL